MSSISLKNISKVYPDGTVAVNDVNLTIENKEFVILVGPSGCGKSTTLRMIAGLEPISKGELKIGDRVVNDVAPKDRNIAMVFQSYALYPHMTVYKNMAFGLELRKVPKSEIDKRVREAAKVLDIEHLLKRKPKALSGGQRQRMTIARALVRKPEVLILDDAASALDYATGAALNKALRNTDFAPTVITVSQRVAAIRNADTIVVLDEGEIVGIGTNDELLRSCEVYKEIFDSQLEKEDA